MGFIALDSCIKKNCLYLRLFAVTLLFFAATAFSKEPAPWDLTLTGVENKVAENLRIHLMTLPWPENRFQLQSFEEEVLEAATTAVQAFGYYQASFVFDMASEATSPSTLTVTLGDKVIVSTLDFDLKGEGSDDPVFNQIDINQLLTINAALDQQAYEQLKDQFSKQALAYGYFDFAWSQHRIDINTETNLATIVLHADTGIRYQFGELRFAESYPSRELITRMRPFTAGEPYQASKLAEFSQSLTISQYYDRALVRPRRDLVQQRRIPIEVMVEHRPRDNFDVGGGVSSDQGVRFKLKWQRPWVNNSGHSMQADLFLSQPEQSITASYKVPIRDTEKNYASYQLGVSLKDDNDTKSETYSIGAQRLWAATDSQWRHTAKIRLEEETFTQGSAEQQTTRLLLPGYSASYLRTDGQLDISWGNKHLLSVEAASDKILADINLVRLLAQTKWIRSIDRHRLVARAEGGVVATNDFDQLPSSLRFFAGGDQSIRGFGYESLSPLDEQGRLTGGQYLAVASLEYSYAVAEDWRAALFADGGTATNDFDEGIASGVGLGAIWKSPVGPVRLYIARGHNDIENTWRLHLSMGPEL